MNNEKQPEVSAMSDTPTDTLADIAMKLEFIALDHRTVDTHAAWLKKYSGWLRQYHSQLAAVTKERGDLINAGGPPFIRSEAIRNLKNDLAGVTAQLAAAKADADRLDYLLTCEPDESRRILSLQPFYAKQEIDAVLAAHRKSQP